jgi:hypothetical protein
MYLIHHATGERREALIESVNSADFKSIKKSKQFPGFNWNKEKRNLVFKLHLGGSDEILGLLSLSDFSDERWIRINLLQSSEENVGNGKKYDRIAGCLIAYACRLAFRKGYDGFVALLPKTALRKHYINKYGMENAGLHIYTALNNSEKLIQNYLQ